MCHTDRVAAYTILPGSLLLMAAVFVVWACGLATLHAPSNETTIALAIGVVLIALGNLTWYVGVSRLGVTPVAPWEIWHRSPLSVSPSGSAQHPNRSQIAGGLAILADVVYAQVISLKHP